VPDGRLALHPDVVLVLVDVEAAHNTEVALSC